MLTFCLTVMDPPDGLQDITSMHECSCALLTRVQSLLKAHTNVS